MLEQCGLGPKEKGQLLASTNNKYDTKALNAALRTQFGEVHMYERSYRQPPRRHAYAAEAEEGETDDVGDDTTMRQRKSPWRSSMGEIGPIWKTSWRGCKTRPTQGVRWMKRCLRLWRRRSSRSSVHL